MEQVAATSPRDLVEFLARSLVENPAEVRVNEIDDGGDVVLEVSVAEGDHGRVIGRGGRVANAIRTLAKAAATRSDQRVVVEILDD